MRTLHLEMLFKTGEVYHRKDVYLLRDEMFNTYRYVVFWDPMNDEEVAGDDVILRDQYPNEYIAIKNLRYIPNLVQVRKIVDSKMYTVEEFIEKEIGKEDW